MVLTLLTKGLVIGFPIAAPVGPIGVLCIRRPLSEGLQAGLATGLGAAMADAAYGCVAALGLTAVSSFLIGHRWWLAFLGGSFLCFLGIRTFFAKPTARNGRVPEGGLRSAFLTTFVLTLTNPMTILSFVAVFAGLGLGSSPDFRAASVLVAGVFVGSALWWLVLSGGVALFQSRFSPAWMQVVNRVSGSVTFAFGIYSLATVWSL